MNLKQCLAVGIAVAEAVYAFLGGDDEEKKDPGPKAKRKGNKKQKEVATDGSGK